MKLKFLGAAQTVTGSCYLLTTDHHKFLIDCGMFQGSKEIREHNYGDFPFSPAEIDYLLLTHAHIDHSGLIPKLVNHGFKGQILATFPTIDLCSIMLPDSGHIQEMEVEQKNRKASRSGKPLLTPIYTAADGINAMKYFRPVAYSEVVQLTPEVRVRFSDAGHILGSAMVEIWVMENGKETRMIFSGDIGNLDQPIVEEPSILEGADYVIMESTYGDRFHEHRESRLNRLKEVIWETYNKGGKLLIPSFAIERTQDLLYELALLHENGDIPEQDIYIDSPLAIAATEVFNKNVYYFDDEAKNFFRGRSGVFNLPNLRFSRTSDDSIALNELSGRAIILAGSGMCDAGRIKHHLKHNLWRAECTVLIVGFQAEGTLGRRLLEGEKHIKIHGEDIFVRAQVKSIPGFSAHADQAGLLRWVKGFTHKPKTIFLTHGEPAYIRTLGDVITRQTSLKCHAPKMFEEVALTAGREVENVVLEQPGVIMPPVNEFVTPEAVERAYMQLRMALREWVELEMDAAHYQELLDGMMEIEKRILTLRGHAGDPLFAKYKNHPA